MAKQNEILLIENYSGMNIASLENTINAIDTSFSRIVSQAINRSLTARNWLIGYYIVEYEQKGSDRAQYGASVLEHLASRLNRPSLSYRNLNVFRQFYQEFPLLGSSIIDFISSNPILQSPIAELGEGKIRILQSPIAQLDNPVIPTEKLFNCLSYTHFVQLLSVKDSLARTFYEYEAIRGTWSVRELKRQIDSNAYFRCGIGASPEKMSQYIQQGAEQSSLVDVIKSPYVFEFLGLQAKEVVTENDLESALIDHLQEFMLELGKGFCFEARQPRIIIDDEYYYPDLVFYNRVLHCHVIIELKDEAFSHQNIGQLNAYVSYYKENEKGDKDNDPVGILLCTKSGKKMVEYALAGMDNNLFVSTYMLQLPNKEQLEQFLKEQIKTTAN